MQVSLIPNKEPASADELVQFIARSAQQHYQRTGCGIDGSVLAHVIRDEYPGLDYAKLGLSKLADAVRLGEAKQLLRRNPNVKHLEVCPIQSELPAAPAPPSRLTRAELLFVKPELWKAAVLSPPGSRARFNTSTGRLMDASAPNAINGDPSLVDVERVTESEQLTWLKEFLRAKGLRIDEDDEQHLQHLLTGGIREFGPAITQDWRTFRSRKAVDHVRQWAARNNIPESSVLMPASREAKRERSSEVDNEDVVRRAVLAAIAELPLSELEEIWLPLRSVLRHFTVK